MGSILSSDGVAFRVWAPHAQRVSVIGAFNDWDGSANPMQPEPRGYWYVNVETARIGDHYKYQLVTQGGEIKQCLDPYAREVTNSVGNAIVHDPDFDWEGDELAMAKWNELVLYELHVGTFNDDDSSRPGRFISITSRLDYLKRLGINAIQIMPVGQFAGMRSWGYNPSQIFAVDSDYGGSLGFKRFIKRSHQEGIAVILDVVYNHFGPSDLDLWQFDGWSENGKGGIYFYNDDRAITPWGETRPDYGRGEVRQYILDNVRMWLDEYHIDGLRFDSTLYIRNAGASGTEELPDGWSILQAINETVAGHHLGGITIAEDLQSNDWITKDVGAGGAGFGSQWDPNFVRPIREAVITPEDDNRSLESIRDAILFRYNDDAFERVIYSESHDDVANGQARIPQEVNPSDPTGWYAQKRSTMAAALVFTAPGIPMLFQGQEFLEGAWFRDSVPVDWDQRDEFRGIVRLYRDLIRLRLNRQGFSRGLCGQFTQVHHLNDEHKVLAFHRWDLGGPGDDVVVIANFFRDSHDEYVVGMPAAGTWKLRFNSDWHGYSELFEGYPGGDVEAIPGAWDGLPFHASIQIAPYSILIYSQL
ncbi:alpha-amylase family glycosyl hydrolase [Synechococcus sp. CS-1328]|uniref:alpha-amylase family glycosyl hydrolase n=1 Tax=Synechococcus sp. CS-1328 TaxID=2847976 RepID=UPI00223C05DB|nr:alpha-amylase family glycosyl hydrolase [Synechococcus sp. CS-1328]MCT0225034.1 alpha amylase C-terminal domain-containing protein [Synechococcus sp. CS-1328]